MRRIEETITLVDVAALNKVWQQTPPLAVMYALVHKVKTREVEQHKVMTPKEMWAQLQRSGGKITG